MEGGRDSDQSRASFLRSRGTEWIRSLEKPDLDVRFFWRTSRAHPTNGSN